MSEKGKFILKLLDACGQPWRGPARIIIENEQEREIYNSVKRYEGPICFTNLWAVPRGRHLVHVKTHDHTPASRYVTVYGSKTNEAPIELITHYGVADRYGRFIKFPTSGELSNMGFSDLKQVIENEMHGEIKTSTSEECEIRQIPGLDYYDQLIRSQKDNHRKVACLLNICTKMKNTALDKNNGRKVWNIMQSIICVKEDRIFAQTILENDSMLNELERSELFEVLDSSLHDVDPPKGFQKYRWTFKSKDEFGNLQLSFSSRDLAGKQLWIVDADIDEKTGLGHIFEVFHHWVTGAITNPYAVHQLLCRQGYKPPYDLLTKPPEGSLL